MSAGADAIVSLLGGARRLGSTRRKPLPAAILLHEQALAGFDSAALASLIEHLSVPRRRLAELLNTSEKTLERRLSRRQRLTTSESNALVRIARIVSSATTLLKTDAAMNSWLSREQPGLGGRVPLDLMRTDTGAAEVELLLERLYHSVLP